jgi:DNA-binding NarL/FixJ family response regulator
MKTSSPTRKTRVLLADDHAVVREGLKFLLNQQPDITVIAEAADGEEAFQQTKKLLPDVVVMDVSMPQCSGIEATERLKQSCPKVRVLALTAHETLDYLRRLLKAGASGYVTKRSAPMELTRAVRAVAAGETYLDATMAGALANDMAGRMSSGGAGATEDISPREVEVLRDIARGYSNKEIAARLQISVKTVETYKARLMKKLKLHSRVDIVRYASHQGWLEEE